MFDDDDSIVRRPPRRCMHMYIYYVVDDKRDCKVVPRVPIIQRETFALAILLGYVMRSLLNCLYTPDITFCSRARKMTRPYFFFYATIIPSDSSMIYVYRNNRKRGPVVTGLEYRSHSRASLLKSLNAPNEQRLPTSLFINTEIKCNASEKSVNPDSSLIVSESLTTLKRHVALMVAPRVSSHVSLPAVGSSIGQEGSLLKFEF